MWFRNFKIWLLAMSIAFISACGSQDSGGNSNAALLANGKFANTANTSLLDSLAVLYPNGQMSEQQKTFAAKELLQNPAALRKTAPASASISGQSASGTVAAQVATGNFGPVYRIQNTTLSGSYFFTIYDFERDSALALHPEWNLEGTAFYTSRVAAPGLNPVHRFQNKLNGSYLYSIYETERADIVANYSDVFAYEGISWYASQTAQAGYTPLYRFRNKVNGTYLFSAYETEKDAIITNYSAIFELEGIAYYVRQSDPLELSLLAGGLGGFGNLDGVGSEARFGYSYGVAVDAAGNAFVTDISSRTIRKVTPAGDVTTFAGNNDTTYYGIVDGTGAAARFTSPFGIAIDSLGNLFVSDGRVIRKITPAAVVTTFAGNFTTLYSLPSVDGTGTAASFRNIQSITIDSADNLYVADSSNYTIRKITPAGVVTTVAGDVTGTYSATPMDGSALAAKFVNPRSITVDSANNIYVADQNRQIRKISAGVVSTLAGDIAFFGAPQDGTATAAKFGSILDIKADATGNIFVADSSTRSIRKVTSAGVVTTFAGALAGTYPTSISGYLPLDGTGTSAQFGSPSALAIDTAGNLFAMDSYTLRKISPAAVVTTIAGKIAQRGTTDGTGPAARFNYNRGMVFDSTGNMYVLNQLDGLIRKVTQAGVVTTLAGGATSFTVATGDGTGSGANFNFPSGIAIDATDNLYVSDQRAVRKITPTGVVTTIVGVRSDYTSSPTDGASTVARFGNLSGIVIDSTGNLYVSEFKTIRKITTAGVVSTFAGSTTSTGVSADGNGVAAKFNSVSNMAIDNAGTLYVSDSGRIRKVTAAADVTTFSAIGYGYLDGDISVAKFSGITGFAFDSSNNIYVTDTGNSAVRKITTAGQVSTVVGTAGRRGVIEGLLSGVANLASPNGVGVYGGKLYISDENSILKVNGLP